MGKRKRGEKVSDGDDCKSKKDSVKGLKNKKRGKGGDQVELASLELALKLHRQVNGNVRRAVRDRNRVHENKIIKETKDDDDKDEFSSELSSVSESSLSPSLQSSDDTSTYKEEEEEEETDDDENNDDHDNKNIKKNKGKPKPLRKFQSSTNTTTLKKTLISKNKKGESKYDYFRPNISDSNLFLGNVHRHNHRPSRVSSSKVISSYEKKEGKADEKVRGGGGISKEKRSKRGEYKVFRDEKDKSLLVDPKNFEITLEEIVKKGEMSENVKNSLMEEAKISGILDSIDLKSRKKIKFEEDKDEGGEGGWKGIPIHLPNPKWKIRDFENRLNRVSEFVETVKRDEERKVRLFEKSGLVGLIDGVEFGVPLDDKDRWKEVKSSEYEFLKMKKKKDLEKGEEGCSTSDLIMEVIKALEKAKRSVKELKMKLEDEKG